MDDATAVADLPRRIDHTVLGPQTSPSDVDRAAEIANELGTNLCVPPCYVDRAARTFDRGALVSVVGFPHGQHARETVVAEAEAAAADGADELDAVVNAGRLQAAASDGDPNPEASDDDPDPDASGARTVARELEAIVDATPLPVKAIVCAPLLDRPALELAGELAAEAGCSHVKTATGFNGGGATVEDVRVLAEYLPVKASGGIGSWAGAKSMLSAGAERIGASSGDVIVEEWRAATGASE